MKPPTSTPDPPPKNPRNPKKRMKKAAICDSNFPQALGILGREYLRYTADLTA